MKALVVYDSMFGNTEKVAQSIGKAVNGEVIPAKESKPSKVKDLDILIVGSPTHGGRPTPAVQEFLQEIPSDSLKNTKVAAFDTRIAAKDLSGFLKFLVNLINYAAPKIAKSLEKAGGNLVVEAEGFFVKDKEGPLKDRELERASEWGRKILESKK